MLACVGEDKLAEDTFEREGKPKSFGRLPRSCSQAMSASERKGFAKVGGFSVEVGGGAATRYWSMSRSMGG